MKLKNYTALLLVTLLFAAGCDGQKKAAGGYDLEHPVKFDLPKSVDQISGITYSRDNAVYAIDDDNSSLYKISLQTNPKVESWNFNNGNDVEDVAMVNNNFYVLNSVGSLLNFSLPVKETAQYSLTVKGKNEFETLVYDASSNQLIVVCKECADDKKSETSAYTFDVKSNTFNSAPAFKIEKKEIEKKLGKDIDRFKPSAAAIHPVTKELYILSSVNKLLVVLDAGRKVKYSYALNSNIFKQPEGITFTPTGDMLISNEASKSTPANILLFKKQ